MKTMIKNLSKVDGFEKFEDYSVTSDGEVISHKGKEDRVLKGGGSRHEYLHVGLFLNGKRKGINIHTLVALAFVKGYEENLEVNHVDEDKKNNNYKNLEWITHTQNCNYGTRNEKIRKALNKPVAQLTLDGKLVKIWDSMMQAEQIGGFNNGNISSVCSGRYKTSGGFYWEYLENNNWDFTEESELVK